MPKPERHGTDKHHTYSGETEALALLEWLNEAKPNAGRKRVLEILELYDNWRSGLEVMRAPVEMRAKLVKRHLEKYPGSSRNLVLRLDRLLRRYQYYPMFFAMDSPISIQWFPVLRGNKSKLLGWADEYDDYSAIFDLAQLAGANLLHRFRKCHCGKWIFARFSHQRFCSVKCREKEFRSSPAWKEYRRKKAREYYQLHKSGKVK